MIDNLLGRPSNNLRRIEVISLLAIAGYILKRKKGGSSSSNWISTILNKYFKNSQPWRIVLGIKPYNLYTSDTFWIVPCEALVSPIISQRTTADGENVH
jgi:hypothetical protein